MAEHELPKRESLLAEFKSDRGKKGGGSPDDDLVEEAVGMTNTERGTLYLGA
ncbi:ATP-binding protein [Mesosutterella sp. OilRF-GAM-744-9]|uniref:ATP-binding protein n=1 Tax=Mesosutterella porci TaxID=2915351 RepID=A0ABS9MQ54_9BURK|nr:ATP-binding protein [Mesosutterella sp. oilRF-744-WT-GAM-9]MCG5030748.1 ATP-binding protein [Mesosutterella sp. oilRF-744-WT-GAM-9]MCI6531200.1 ATP-binding protein [Mesosutterella sp.]